MSLKIELLKLGKKQIDLLDEVRKRGYPNLYETQLSLYLSGRDRSPQGKAVRKVCEEVILLWQLDKLYKKEQKEQKEA